VIHEERDDRIRAGALARGDGLSAMQASLILAAVIVSALR
jgi:hypothetical protein